jgi:hypothetical protein
MFTEGVVLWMLLVLLGYAQWFLLLPLISRICRLGSARAARRTPARE